MPFEQDWEKSFEQDDPFVVQGQSRRNYGIDTIGHSTSLKLAQPSHPEGLPPALILATPQIITAWKMSPALDIQKAVKKNGFAWCNSRTEAQTPPCGQGHCGRAEGWREGWDWPQTTPSTNTSHLTRPRVSIRPLGAQPCSALPSWAFLPHKRQSSMSGHATERTCESKRPVSGLQGALCCCLQQVSRKIMRNIWHIWKSYSLLLLPPQPQAGHQCVQSVKLAPETAAEKSEKHQECRP